MAAPSHPCNLKEKRKPSLLLATERHAHLFPNDLCTLVVVWKDLCLRCLSPSLSFAQYPSHSFLLKGDASLFIPPSIQLALLPFRLSRFSSILQGIIQLPVTMETIWNSRHHILLIPVIGPLSNGEKRADSSKIISLQCGCFVKTLNVLGIF